MAADQAAEVPLPADGPADQWQEPGGDPWQPGLGGRTGRQGQMMAEMGSPSQQPLTDQTPAEPPVTLGPTTMMKQKDSPTTLNQGTMAPTQGMTYELRSRILVVLQDR